MGGILPNQGLINRIASQRRQINLNAPVNWYIRDGDSWNQWNVWITAHDDCPFHSIPIQVIVIFPNNYPDSNPTFSIQKPHLIFHPNIYKDGRICDKRLNNANLRTRQKIDAIISLLSMPNPDNPANPDAASLYKKNQRQYCMKVANTLREIKRT